jgi:hypothetical protein
MHRKLLGRPASRLPDVIGLGAEKCGSTSLFYYLRAHPEIGVQRRKETQFFAANFHRGLDWYRRQFPAGARVLFEVHGGNYSKYPSVPGVAERIAAALPAARFVYVVRDPVERIVSRWMHHYANGDEHASFEESLRDLDGNRYVVPTLYFTQLERYLRLYPADRFHLFTAEELRDDRLPTLRRLFRFLGVDESFESPEFSIRRHPSALKRRNTGLGLVLQRKVGDRVTRRLHGRSRHLFKRLVYAPVSRAIPRPEPSAELRRRLRDYFAPDLKRLEQFMGRSLAAWYD